MNLLKEEECVAFQAPAVFRSLPAAYLPLRSKCAISSMKHGLKMKMRITP